MVYHVATPAFGRRLLWALVLPLFVTSFVGIWQFHGFSDANFHAAVNASWLWWPFTPLIWLLDQFFWAISWLCGWGDRQLGMVGLSANYFMQSAVPGSTFANKNLAGSWTAMMLPIALYLLVTAKRWPAQALASVLLALGSVFLIYSRARASWIALFASMATLLALVVLVPAWRQAVLRHLDWTHLLWLMLPVAAVLRWGGDISPVNGAYAVDRTPAQQVAALAGSSWNEIGGRLAYNLNSLVITKDYWFNGVGLGSFYTIYPKYYDALVVTPTNSYNVMARPQRTHTDLMQAFDEMGIPGGLLFAGLFIGGIAMALRMAGNRAGALGGKLIGCGMLTMITALAAFLESQSMLALPGKWNLLLYAILISAILGLFASAVRDWLNVRKDTAPADDIQLMGLLAGIAVLTISINALMDFPMQLPTAPGAAMLLLGLITALYVRQRAATPGAAKVGPRLVIDTNRLGPLLLTATLIVSWSWAMWDGYKFRQGNILLKAAMVRIFSSVNDDTTLALITQAYQTYPTDPRIHEHMGVVFANYNGSVALPIEDKIDRLEWVLKGDPYGANHIINLAGQYLQLAEMKQQQRDETGRALALARTEELYARLQRVANFSHFTWGIGGLLRLMEGRNDEAASMFRRALAIEPTYGPAVSGLKVAVERGASPLIVRDGITGSQGVGQ
jgi:hypothetical protein